jgi:hypothetical protein
MKKKNDKTYYRYITIISTLVAKSKNKEISHRRM